MTNPICKACRKPAESLSRRGLCGACGTERMTAAVIQMHERSGPVYEKQVAAVRRAADRRRSTGAA